MNRYTIKQLNEMHNKDFIISILNERLNKLNPYSPLAQKINSAKDTINRELI